MHSSGTRLLAFILLCLLSISLASASPIRKGKGKQKADNSSGGSSQVNGDNKPAPPPPMGSQNVASTSQSSNRPQKDPKDIPNYNPNYNPRPDVFSHGDFVGARIKNYEDTKSDSIHPGVVVGGPDTNNVYKVAMISNRLPNNPPQKEVDHYQPNAGLGGNVSHDTPKDISWNKMKMWKQRNSGHGDRQPVMAPEKVKELKDDINKECEDKGVHLTRRGPGGTSACVFKKPSSTKGKPSPKSTSSTPKNGKAANKKAPIKPQSGSITSRKTPLAQKKGNVAPKKIPPGSKNAPKLKSKQASNKGSKVSINKGQVGVKGGPKKLATNPKAKTANAKKPFQKSVGKNTIAPKPAAKKPAPAKANPVRVSKVAQKQPPKGPVVKQKKAATPATKVKKPANQAKQHTAAAKTPPAAKAKAPVSGLKSNINKKH